MMQNQQNRLHAEQDRLYEEQDRLQDEQNRLQTEGRTGNDFFHVPKKRQ
jgi:hypothetical protein